MNTILSLSRNTFTFVAMLLASAADAQNNRYAIFELPRIAPGADASVTYSINEQGWISGTSDESTSPSPYHSVIWNPEFSIRDLGTLGGENSEARMINEAGEVVGESNFSRDNADEHAFYRRDGEMTDLGTLGGEESQAFAINNLGQIVGNAETVDGGGPVIWEDNEIRALPTLGEDGGTAYDINDAGETVGNSVPTSGRTRAVLWQNDEVRALPDLNDGPSVGLAINDSGWVVGQSRTANSNPRAVLWIDGEIFSLHRPGLGKSSSAWGINGHGQIVGWVGDPLVSQQAFLWEQGQGMRVLNDLIPSRLSEPWRITMAHDINDAGQIAAYGKRKGAPFTLIAFLVNPVHPTMELSGPTPGVAGAMNTFEVTNAPPGAKVIFAYSRNGGGFRIPGCDLQQNALQLENPKIVGSAIADANGNASIQRFVPKGAAGKIILFQAVVVNDCAISQLVGHKFE